MIKAAGLGLRTRQGWVFRDVDLSLPDGSAVAIAGPAGSGRTMLLLTLAGRARPSTGELRVAGTVRRADIRRQVAVARATGAVELDPDLHVGDCRREAGAAVRRTRTSAGPRSSWASTADRATPVGDLAPDDAALLALALAAAARPAALVLDDVDLHTTHAQQRRVWTALTAVAAEGISTITSSRSTRRIAGDAVVYDLGEESPCGRLGWHGSRSSGSARRCSGSRSRSSCSCRCSTAGCTCGPTGTRTASSTQIPVAVVNSDQPVTVNGQAGRRRQAVRRRAEEGPRSSTGTSSTARRRPAASHDTDYYFEISVPSDFSRKLASGADTTPQRARMLITLDDANGYIVGKMAQTVQAELENKISAAAVSAYFQSVFDNLEQLRDGVVQAVDGAGQLRDGAASAEKGSATRVSGIGELKAGADKLAPGAQQVSDGVSAIADVVVPAANTIADAAAALTQTRPPTAAARPTHSPATAAQAADAVAGGTGSVQEPGDRARHRAPRAAVDDPAYQELVRVTGQPPAGFATGQVGRGGDGPEDHDGDRRTAHAQQLAQDAPRAAVGGPRRGDEDLRTGRRRQAGGVRRRRAAGHAASARRRPARTTLHDGITQLSSGATSLADGLTDAERRIPVLSDDAEEEQRRDPGVTGRRGDARTCTRR